MVRNTRSTSYESGRRIRPRMRARRSKSEASIPKKRQRLNSKIRCATAHGGSKAAGGPKIQILTTPIKSPADKNNYRIIQLPNGLRAILISYIPCLQKRHKIQKSRECLDKAIVEFNANIVGVELRDAPKKSRPASSRKQIKPDVKPMSSTKKAHLENCNCKDSTAWIVLNVGTGYYYDPKELPGCAHLMEHLIITGGSAKYPNSRFLDFMNQYETTYYNASTHVLDVGYYLGIAYKDLPMVIDTFSNLFLAPTVYLKDVLSEREAVDSEYLDKKYIDLRKIFRMYQLCMNPDHPAASFHVGSKDTLVAPDGNDETLRKMLMDYFERDYGAGNITVAISAPEQLDDIQELVVKYFGPIPKRSVKVHIPAPENYPSTDPSKFKRFYRVKPHLDMNMLWVGWDLPLSAAKNFETKPITYLACLIETEGPGGLAVYLKKMKWISEIFVLISDVEDNEYTSALFRVVFNLKKTETETVFKIVESLHSYLKFLLEVGPQEWYFNEIRWNDSMRFHFFNSNSQIDQARNLRHYQPEDCLIGAALITKWDPSAITACHTFLTPGNANVMIVSKSVENCNLLEPIYDVKYGVMEDEQYQCWIKNWTAIKPFEEFKFPCPNKFITTNFCGITPCCKNDPECKSQLGKVIEVISNDKIEFHNCKREGISAAYMLSISTTVPLYTTQNEMLLDIWVRLLERKLRPILYGVEDALLSYYVCAAWDGITIGVDGFSQHLNSIVLEICKQIENLFSSVSAEMFEAEKTEILEANRNGLDSPDWLAVILQHAIYYENINLPWPQMYNTLVRITFEDFQRFWIEFKERLFIGVTAQGDVDRDNSLKLATSITEILAYEPFLRSFELGRNPNQPTINQLPLGETILRVRSRNLRSNKSHIACFYQIPYRNKADYTIGRFLAKKIDFPAFAELRRNQDLGYHIGGYSSGAGIAVFVNSHSHKFSGTHVKNRIVNFVKEFFEKELQKLTQADIPKTMSCCFKIKVSQILEFYEKYLLPGPTSEMRRLTIQIVGKADQELSEEYAQDLSTPGRGNRKLKNIKNADISVIVLAPKVNEEESTCPSQPQQYIRNIMDFKSQLSTYPNHYYMFCTEEKSCAEDKEHQPP